MTIRVLVNGAKGRMGQDSVRAIRADGELELVGETDLGDDLAVAIRRVRAQVVVDFTTASAGYANAETILRAGARPVIGTSGFTKDQVAALEKLCAQQQLGGVIAPNFAIGAVLMMKFAAEAARYMPHAEIIELHHDQKADAPSGTAVKTAELIAEARPQAPTPKVKETELAPGARGAGKYPVRIHSVRLPGLNAHQEVILGGLGQTLTIRHDSLSRDSFMPGVVMAVKKAVTLDRLVYGLEHLL